MGVRYRKKTGNKSAWLNWSYSEKNGLNTSLSVKTGPFTWNSGNGKTTKKRITTNLPGGFYHVTESEKSRPSKSSQQTTPSEPWNDEDTAFVKRWAVYLIVLVGGTSLLGWYGFCAALGAILVWQELQKDD